MPNPLRKSPIALALLCALPAAAHAQQGLSLRMQTTITVLPDAKSDAPAPIYLEADRIQGYSERETEASGNARARSRGQAFSADWMRFDHRINELTAIGNVHLEQGAYVVEGLRLRYDIDSERGVLENARYSVNARATGNLPIAGGSAPNFDGRGTAERIVFDGPGVFRAQQASFTTCEPGNDGWFIRAKDLVLYRERGEGVARDARIEVEGTSILYTPYFSFPLHRERKSGFLAPHFGSSTTSGLEISAPYFWNLAPNYDLTLTPRVMTRRGLQLRSEFRYLQPQYEGKAYFDLLPEDRVADRTRQLLSLRHKHQLWNDWQGTLDYTRVSDGRYFTDLSTRVALTSQTHLSQSASLARSGTWAGDGTYTFGGAVQNWQTLQSDPLVPLTPPYSRRPQLTFTAQNTFLGRADFDLNSSYVDFFHPSLPRGRRMMAYPSVTLPLQTAGAYFTPKIGVHMTRYQMDRETSSLPNSTRVLPIATAATGLTFERNANIFGNAFTQTLEPKAYYVYIPFKNQSLMPNFESGVQDINFATIFSENQFSGHDRINDANQLTLGAMSRLIDPKTGIERLRVGFAQRYYFRSQDVTVPGVPPRSNQSSRSDLLAVLSGRVAPHVTADVGWQFNTDTSQTQRSNISLRYQPEPGKLLNVAYRQNVPASIRQFDVSGQWPIHGKWGAVGRWNYSTQDRRVLEGLAGLEYDGGCYYFRVVGHRVSTATNAANTAVFVELELNGLTRVGSNSLELLRRNVSGYTRGDPYQSRPGEYFVPER